jgi:hypothetical protein
METDAHLRGCSLPNCEYYHRYVSSDKAKNEWDYASNSQYIFVDWCTAKQRGKLLFILPAFPLHKQGLSFFNLPIRRYRVPVRAVRAYRGRRGIASLIV